MCSADIFLGLLALLFPPLPVWVKRGLCSADSLINILLCLLGYIPGLIHAWYIIAKFPEPDYEYESVPQQDREGGRVTYVFVHGNGNGPHTQQPQQQPRPSQHNKGNLSYGTATNNNSSTAAAGGSSRPQPQQPQQYQDQGAGEGSSDGAVPPSYAEVVAGDNKIQTRD
ncbi:plasma membrane proteolipid 3 [Colletotrichum liriopes]|uniref:Plasma membrane proteolipid 3 n=1 Tax=Colletotrichum liriopes TaxID=708192 RepID=A0AA37GD96_9PEZI|nr:plasma membrane proteolipid 3 [Colletotrichum liriopes]